tara:strand:- start:208 stop:357 length:150 start_codon:yes stop_codon:yes gene_type:complete
MNRYAEVVEIEIYPLPMKMSSEKVKSFEKGGAYYAPQTLEYCSPQILGF